MRRNPPKYNKKKNRGLSKYKAIHESLLASAPAHLCGETVELHFFLWVLSLKKSLRRIAGIFSQRQVFVPMPKNKKMLMKYRIKNFWGRLTTVTFLMVVLSDYEIAVAQPTADVSSCPADFSILRRIVLPRLYITICTIAFQLNLDDPTSNHRYQRCAPTQDLLQHQKKATRSALDVISHRAFQSTVFELKRKDSTLLEPQEYF